MIELEILALIWLTGLGALWVGEKIKRSFEKNAKRLAIIRLGEVLKKARTENESDDFRDC